MPVVEEVSSSIGVGTSIARRDSLPHVGEVSVRWRIQGVRHNVGTSVAGLLLCVEQITPRDPLTGQHLGYGDGHLVPIGVVGTTHYKPALGAALC